MLNSLSVIDQRGINQIQNTFEVSTQEEFDVLFEDLKEVGLVYNYINKKHFFSLVFILFLFLLFTFLTVHLFIDKLFFRKFYEQPDMFKGVRRGLLFSSFCISVIFIKLFAFLNIFTFILTLFIFSIIEYLFLQFYNSGKIIKEGKNKKVQGKVISAGGIVARRLSGKRQILFINHEHAKGLSFPKGHVQNAESIEETALREIREETGLQKLSISSKLGVVSRKSLDKSEGCPQKDIHIYLVKSADCNHKEADSEYLWVEPKKALKNMAFKEEQEFLKSVINKIEFQEDLSRESLDKYSRKVKDNLEELNMDVNIRNFSKTTRTAVEAAEAIECEVGQIAKSLVFQNQKNNEAVLIIASGKNRVNVEKLNQKMSLNIKIADADFVRSKTGFSIGGVPPVGHTEKIKTFIDKDLLEFEEIWAAAGSSNTVFKIKSDELVKITKGEVIEI
ncbi:NUDIX domain-containing protein [Candidatus Dojkabacteria bacterium]|nr:NUDIX domain-containing protein [Candidatus Dojkabacteria bacterium]